MHELNLQFEISKVLLNYVFSRAMILNEDHTVSIL